MFLLTQIQICQAGQLADLSRNFAIEPIVFCQQKRIDDFEVFLRALNNTNRMSISMFLTYEVSAISRSSEVQYQSE